MLIKAQIVLRMTKEEVERIVIPHFNLSDGAYHYWWNNDLIVVRPLPHPLPNMEGPVLIMMGDMPVEVVDEVDTEYNIFPDPCPHSR